MRAQLEAWENAGSLGGVFTAPEEAPSVVTIDGVKGVSFDGTSYLEGPESPSSIDGNSPRSIQAWVYNPEALPEETVMSWGKRGGPNGTNMAFNHGTHNAYGAIGHWGGGTGVGTDQTSVGIRKIKTTMKTPGRVRRRRGYGRTSPITGMEARLAFSPMAN